MRRSLTPIAIRPFQAHDLPAVKHLIDSTQLFPSDMLDEMTSPFLAGGSEEVWLVAVQDGAACGVAYAAPERMTDGTWNLLLIAVRDDRHGQGIGGAMTRQIEQTLIQRQARVLLVETSGLAAFERTRAVYRRLGYVEEARIRDYYSEAEDKVVFWKSLRATVAD